MSKTYLITGATSPLGLALMERLLPTLAEGDLILAQGCGDLARLAGLCQARPGFIRPYDADFTQPLAVRAFLSDLVDTYPAPTHIIHLPGLRPIQTAYAYFDEERFADDRAVQLDSALLLCKTFLPRMAQAGSGRVLFLTGGVPAAQMASTAVVKSSLEGLARSLAAEYASSGVTVNCIAPGPLLTEDTAGDPAAVRPEEVVPAMLFLLSEDAARINGVTLPIDGGTALR